MHVITPGHKYGLDNFEKDGFKGQTLQFIEKDLDPSGIGVGGDGKTLYTINNGTTNEEVLLMLLNRMNFLQKKFPCKENACCITHLQEALMWLNERTSKRITQGVEGQHVGHES